MSLTVAIVALAVILIVVLYGGSQLFDGIFSVFDHANGVYTATQLKPRPNIDETICDLRVEPHAELWSGSLTAKSLNIDDNINPFPAEIWVHIDDQNAFSYTWFNCESSVIKSPFELIYKGDAETLDFFTTGGESISSQIVLIDKADPTQKVDAYTQSWLKQDIQLTSSFGFVDTPYDLSKEFVVKNIPLREYTLEIYYGQEINNLGIGEPYRVTVPNHN